MIAVTLQGGLGNQMFQYAAGRALADRNDDRLILDTSQLRRKSPGSTARMYDLDRFAVRGYTTARLRRSLAVLRRLDVLPVHTDGQNGRINEAVTAWQRSAWLFGYWQSEAYFSASDRIRDDLQFPLIADSHLQRIEDEALRSNSSVSIHVRRGDYVSNPTATAFHGVLGLDYYETAVAAICERVANPRFFVFSEDISWCRSQLRLPAKAHFLQGASISAVDDMRVMAACTHHIVANSSFSWWGAWLGEDRDGFVVAPRRWFADPTRDSADVVPHRWLRV